jgi:ribosomal protein S28E/S33
MNIGTRCSNEVFTEGGVLVIAGRTLAAEVRVAVLVRVGDGPDRTALVMVVLLGPVDVGDVGAVAPAHPARTVASAVAPVMERAA